MAPRFAEATRPVPARDTGRGVGVFGALTAATSAQATGRGVNFRPAVAGRKEASFTSSTTKDKVPRGGVRCVRALSGAGVVSARPAFAAVKAPGAAVLSAAEGVGERRERAPVGLPACGCLGSAQLADSRPPVLRGDGATSASELQRGSACATGASSCSGRCGDCDDEEDVVGCTEGCADGRADGCTEGCADGCTEVSPAGEAVGSGEAASSAAFSSAASRAVHPLAFQRPERPVPQAGFTAGACGR
mmetsp:Transcript_136177/g.303333  ORF Transcript_136177/g.303333 Transcript_136177/m.303333 type:complete len:247 (+) Transcript_136177:24-764(+)